MAITKSGARRRFEVSVETSVTAMLSTYTRGVQYHSTSLPFFAATARRRLTVSSIGLFRVFPSVRSLIPCFYCCCAAAQEEGQGSGRKEDQEKEAMNKTRCGMHTTDRTEIWEETDHQPLCSGGAPRPLPPGYNSRIRDRSRDSSGARVLQVALTSCIVFAAFGANGAAPLAPSRPLDCCSVA